MADGLNNLVELLALEAAHEAGDIDDAEYARAMPPILVGSPDATGFLVVPRPLPKDAWINEEEDARCAALSDGPVIPEYDRPKPPPPPTPTWADGQPKPKSFTARLKSLAGRRLRR